MNQRVNIVLNHPVLQNVKELNRVRRGIKKAIWERVEHPSLNCKGEFRFSLLNTWDRVLRRFPRRLSRDPFGSRDLQH